MNTVKTIFSGKLCFALSVFLLLLAGNVDAIGKVNASTDGQGINNQLLLTYSFNTDTLKTSARSIDDEAPVFIVIPRNGIAVSLEEVAFDFVMAVDNSSAVEISHSDIIDGNVKSGIVTRTWTATDQSGNSSTASAVVRYYGTELTDSETDQNKWSQDQKKEESDFALYQNFPNPFSKATVVPFYLPKADDVTLKVYDASGRVLYICSGNFEKGDNNFNVNGFDLKSEGILYYELLTSKFKHTGKMLFNTQ